MNDLNALVKSRPEYPSDLRELPADQALTFLLRCHKGRFYRNRYPSLALVQGGGS